MNRKRLIAIPLFCLLLLSCRTIERPNGRRGHLQGMVYDCENRPVNGYRIDLDRFRSTVTDINGRFCFDSVKYGQHLVCGSGASHLPSEEAYGFEDGKQIIYLRVPSNNWLYSWIDRQIAEGKLDDIERNLGRFSEDEKKGLTWRLYEAIYRYRTASDSDKTAFLENAERLGEAVRDGN